MQVDGISTARIMKRVFGGREKEEEALEILEAGGEVEITVIGILVVAKAVVAMLVAGLVPAAVVVVVVAVAVWVSLVQ